MKNRNDGSHGKTAAQMIEEDAERNNKANHDSYESTVNYEGDEGDLDIDDIQSLDDDYLNRNDFIDDKFDNDFLEEEDDIN
jgi:hypothetical protein